jgi:hypothetical protein
MASLARLPLVCSLAVLALAPGCQDSSAVYALIGPEGGSVSMPEGPTLTFPPGALLSTRQIVIRPVDDNLTTGNFKQSGGAYRIEPTDLDLKVPVEVTFDADSPAVPSVLWRRGMGRVVAHAAADDRALAYIGALGTIALAAGDVPVAKVDEPAIARIPGEANFAAPAVDTATIKITPAGTGTLEVGFTVYDPMGMSNRPLNGDGSRYCGFKFDAVQGGSITSGCSGNVATGSIALSSTQVVLDIRQFLLSKVDNPVLVEIQVGNGTISNSVGYITFSNSTCYDESCSGHGECDQSGGSPMCVCDDGYAPGEGLTCECVKQCDGRNCGGDGCGGSCGNCGPDSQCNQDAGVCEGMPPPETTTEPPPMSTGEPDPSSTGEPGTSTSTTTGDDTTSTSTSSTSGGSSGDMGSSG